MSKMYRPIDAVILWVDGTDVAWQKQREQYWSKYHIQCVESNSDQRYVSCDELRYCLRSLYQNAPWLRKIYLVTNGQKPKWLKNHPKVKLITHSEIIDAKYLPTFNSCAIEMNLDKIPGLSSPFLYLNDDFFITRPVHRRFFLNSKGQGYYYSNKWLNTPEIEYIPSFLWNIHSDKKCLNELFGPTIRPRPMHQAFLVYLQAYQFLRTRAPNYINATCGHQFRIDSTYSDYSINIYALEAIGLELGLYQYTKLDNKNAHIQQYHNIVNLKKKYTTVLENPPSLLCINNCSTQEDKEFINKLMPMLLPNKAPWEN